MEIPPPNPEKLLDHWMEWEKGEIPPGELMKQLKMHGMRQLLEGIVADSEGGGETVGDVLG
ncbi:hypothetical protein NHL50_00565 [Acidimicrobiia bacterium EGI L10123]|uniref:hypothetical protein n=1 Tax=Salinilacustrithrix flava TaxID=2957203 RepID=UPI003D7C229D|nr:hypothetical protein [Acidimicrobiia bacterium EGI L10123]